jgi:excisionase family DNA binding protein
MPAESFLTTKEVANLLRVSDQSFRAYRRDGRIPEGVRVGRKLLFDPAAIKAALKRLKGGQK